MYKISLWSAAVLFVLVCLMPGCGQKEFKSPAESPGDLAWDGENLWMTAPGQMKIIKVNKKGEQLASFLCSEIGPDGLTFDGTHLWVSSASNRLLKYETSGKLVKDFSSPGNETPGLAWGNGYLYAVARTQDDMDMESNEVQTYIYKINPKDGTTETSYLIGNIKQAEGLAFDGTYLLLIDAIDKKLYRIEPEKGEVWGKQIDLIQEKPKGIAWDGEQAWLSDLDDSAIEPLKLPKEKK